MMNLIWFSDIQDYFEYIIKKHETIVDNHLIQIYTRNVFKIKTGYKLEVLSPEIMKLLGSTKKDVNKNKDWEDVPQLDPVEVILMHSNLVNNNYLQASKVPNKQFGRLINVLPHLLTMLNTTNT